MKIGTYNVNGVNEPTCEDKYSYDRNSRLYSNTRRTFAVIIDASGCTGLISETHSSGTITEGTISTADRSDVIQSDPNFALARPAGMAAHVGGIFATSTCSRRAHVASDTSISIRYRLDGSPESSMCAAVSNTAIAMVGAQ